MGNLNVSLLEERYLKKGLRSAHTIINNDIVIIFFLSFIHTEYYRFYVKLYI